MPREYIPVALKQQVFDRAQGICEYCRCQARFAMGPLVIEHIFPLSQGGTTVAENLALACQGCNNYKYNKTEALDPISSQLVPLFHPRQMAWNDHFAWSEDTTLMIGLTPTGRATVALLRTNRPGVVNLRQVLQMAGQHPPNNLGSEL
jgi:HNH endonuclease